MYYYIITTSTYVFQQLIARWIEWHIDSCFVFSVRWEHFVVQDVAVVFFLLKISSERVFWSQRKILQYMCSNTVIWISQASKRAQMVYHKQRKRNFKMKPTIGIYRKLLDKVAIIVMSCERTGTYIQRTYTKSVLSVS